MASERVRECTRACVSDGEAKARIVLIFRGNEDGWDTSSVPNMRSMFIGATSFNEDLSMWEAEDLAGCANFSEGGQRLVA